MTDITLLCTQLQSRFSTMLLNATIDFNELTLEISPEHLLEVCQALKTEKDFQFDMLVDVCGVDYLHYGLDEWQTESATATGFSRGSSKKLIREVSGKPLRFAVVYHLLSLNHNHRVRLRVSLSADEELMVDSVTEIWPSANWFEREAFDLFGIIFRGHADLRRILTDYGFVGHPFRKDFPLIGKVEARYDANLKRVIYEPVSIEPRILEPKVIRRDNRYLTEKV